jgi:hypothetical protein
MKHTNPYIRLLNRNQSKLNNLQIAFRKIQIIHELLTNDLPFSNEKLNLKRSTQIAECKLLIEQYSNFINSEKTQQSIDNIYLASANFLSPFAKYYNI